MAGTTAQPLSTANGKVPTTRNNNIKLRVAGLKSQVSKSTVQIDSIRASVSLSAAKSGEVAKCTADEYLFICAFK